jgi:hypothetical protein
MELISIAVLLMLCSVTQEVSKYVKDSRRLDLLHLRKIQSSNNYNSWLASRAIGQYSTIHRMHDCQSRNGPAHMVKRENVCCGLHTSASSGEIVGDVVGEMLGLLVSEVVSTSFCDKLSTSLGVILCAVAGDALGSLASEMAGIIADRAFGSATRYIDQGWCNGALSGEHLSIILRRPRKCACCVSVNAWRSGNTVRGGQPEPSLDSCPDVVQIYEAEHGSSARLMVLKTHDQNRREARRLFCTASLFMRLTVSVRREHVR